MRKFFYMAALVAATVGFVSCDDDDNDGPFDTADQYSGTVNVVEVNSQLTKHSEDDIIFETEEYDGTPDNITVTMYQVQFHSAMPMKLDLVLPNIPESATDDYYEIATIQATTTTGTAAPDFITIKDVTVDKRWDDSLTVTFTCTISMDSMSGDFEITYSGVETN